MEGIFVIAMTIVITNHASESTVRAPVFIRQAPVFRHLRALRKSPWKFIIWMNEL